VPSATADPFSSLPVRLIEQPEVVDATGGAISPATARRWADAYLASVRLTVLAVEREQSQLLAAVAEPGQVDPSALRLIQEARSDGAALAYASGHEPHVTRLILVALTTERRDAIRQLGGLAPGSYAWVVTFTGPTDLSVRWPGGRVRTYVVLPPGQQVTELSAGGIVADPTLGDLWREAFSRDCTARPDPVLCPY
jgi:hypothetical protein